MKNKILRDGHVHSPYCPHGTSDGFELYIQRALELGIQEITFTEHMPLPPILMDPEFLKSCALSEDKVEEYFKDIGGLKSKYGNRIKINTGFEVDYIEGREQEIMELLGKYGSQIEDSILSVHFVKVQDEYYCVDAGPEEFLKLAERLGGVEKVYDRYFETLLKSVKAELGPYKPRRLGHPTLVRIFNMKYPLEYRNYELLEELVKEIKARNYEVDYNSAGLRKPYCGETYPSGFFMKLIEKYGVDTVRGSDAHTAADVGRDFDK